MEGEMKNSTNHDELNLYNFEEDEVNGSKNPIQSIISMLDEKISYLLKSDDEEEDNEENVDTDDEIQEDEDSITLNQTRLFKKKIIEQRTELEKLYDKKEKYKLQTEKLREENEELHEKNEQLTEELKELKEEKNSLEEKCNNLTKDNEGSFTKNDVLENRVKDLTNTITQLYGILRVSKELKN
tara:strand:- start:743 stop:1294 length:552 start_codon:yes stop_codon:yes gene_type:complete